MSRKIISCLVLLCCLGLVSNIFGQTDADVGDADSFGLEVKFFGFAQTGYIYFSQDCNNPEFPLEPEDRCVTISQTTGAAIFDLRGLGQIAFPENTFQTIIYLLGRHQISYQFNNPTTSNKFGRLSYRPYITIESDVLSDPSLINPQTGQPFNGKLDVALGGGRLFGKTIFPNSSEFDSQMYSTGSLGGLTKSYFMSAYGLDEATAKKLLTRKMYIYLNMRGTLVNAESSYFKYGIRFLGN